MPGLPPSAVGVVGREEGLSAPPLLMVGLNLASFLCPSCSASISCESTPIASFDCMPRLPIAAFETVPRASLSTNSS